MWALFAGLDGSAISPFRWGGPPGGGGLEQISVSRPGSCCCCGRCGVFHLASTLSEAGKRSVRSVSQPVGQVGQAEGDENQGNAVTKGS